MKAGDIVRWKSNWKHNRTLKDKGVTGIAVSELRHGINSSFVDVLVDGKVIPVNWKVLEVISASR